MLGEDGNLLFEHGFEVADGAVVESLRDDAAAGSVEGFIDYVEEVVDGGGGLRDEVGAGFGEAVGVVDFWLVGVTTMLRGCVAWW